MYVINGVQLPELEIFDADVAAKYEHEMTIMSDAMRSVDSSGSYSSVIYALCSPVFRCFDILFGEGTSAHVFAGKSNIKNCLNAIAELARAVDNQKSAIESLPDELSSILSHSENEVPDIPSKVRRVFTAEEVAELLNNRNNV